MWHQWKPEIIERDFSLLSREGLQVLRVFPLWPDFQPIAGLRSDNGRFVEFRHGEKPLPDDQLFQDGMSPEMLDRFEVLADLAATHHLELIVGLITGWMSGRLFVPPGLEGLNPITDPASILWQIRFARAFVERFKKHPAIRAWDLGNECNVMGRATREQAWVWASGLTNAIRVADPSRPVISGMHSLGANPQSTWSIRDQGEITDILTTHPYPLFTEHCHREPMNTFRPLLHATAETCLYADLSGKPAFVEEFGNLGPMVCGVEETAGFMRASLASLWAHDARAALWWCAHDQLSLEDAPHDWVALERELGLLDENGKPKPVLREIQAFRATLEQLSVPRLPRRRIDAVCILTPGQDQWGVAYSAFILAKQAGFDLQFHYADRALPEAKFYLLPSLQQLSCLTRRRERELWEKVEAGAEVYLSLGDGLLGEFARTTGLEVMTRAERKGPCTFAMRDGSGSFTSAAPVQYEFRVRGAEVLAAEPGGQPAFTVSPLGRGKVHVLTVPLEAALAAEPQQFAGPNPSSLWKIYRTFAAGILQQRILAKSDPFIGVTEHPLDDGDFFGVLINYSREDRTDVISVAPGFAASGVKMNGREPSSAGPGQWQIHLPPHGWSVWRLTKKS
jgi:hypothetical protein